MVGANGVGVIIAAVGAVLLLFAIIRIPIKIIFKLLLNIAVGFVMLFFLNLLGEFFGITVAVNWINAAIVGILGIPGVALILLLQWLMII